MSDNHVCPICKTKHKVKSIFPIDKQQFPYYEKLQKEHLPLMIKIMKGILSFEHANDMDYYQAIQHYAKDESMAKMYAMLSFNASRYRSCSSELLITHRVFELIGGIDRKCAGCTMSLKSFLLSEPMHNIDDIEIAFTKCIIKLTKNAIRSNKNKEQKCN